MTPFPQVKAKDLAKALINTCDFVCVRQAGSHARLHGSNGERVTIPMHNKPLAVGTLNSILKQAGINKNDLLKILK